MVYEVRANSPAHQFCGIPLHVPHLPWPEDTGYLNKSHTSIYHVAYLILPPHSEVALLFSPLFVLPLHRLLFAAIIARIKFELPVQHC